MPRIVLRDARTTDLEALLRLSRILDSTNLPTGREELGRVIARSRRSFAARLHHPAEGVYVFVAEDCRSQRPVGSSMIIAKHGTPESPHYFLEMVNDERYSKTLHKMFRHTSLHLRHSMDGPTEVGGLIVDPRLRHHPERLGTQLSFVRFLYIGVHRERFADDVIAEMKPPLTAKGENRFWQCYGARVTGMTFREADRLSTKDKEFIPALFPNVPIYTCMLPLEVQEEIGKVGPETVGAVRVLERIGLRFLGQVDPFDAGPYYGAQTDAVSVVRDVRRVRLRPEIEVRNTARGEPYLVAVERRGFLAFRAAARRVEDVLFLEPAILSMLGLRPDTPAAVVPIP
ncbi:MAG TPA: arginine N-succinyltransferase [Candidatus Binatia bacterium]|nr:arginine N-succinyltransferase [Candidatus Binatia bacterium]